MVNYPSVSSSFPAYLEENVDNYYPPPAQGTDFDQLIEFEDNMNYDQKLLPEEPNFEHFNWDDFSWTPKDSLAPARNEIATEMSSHTHPSRSPLLMEIEDCKAETKHHQEEDFSEIPEIKAGNLGAIIEKIMQGSEPTDQVFQKLNDIERAILLSIHEKKFSGEEDGKNKGKRVEEKQKLFFKAALKYSENKFFSSILKSNKKKLKKRDLDQQDFYESYFRESARRYNCDISNFFHPNRKLKSSSKKSKCTFDDSEGHAGLKSFNSTYIDLILSSEEFRNDAIEFLENYFVQEYAKTRLQKIDKVVKQIIKVIEVAWSEYQYTKPSSVKSQNKQTLKEFVTAKVRENILNNSKSKLPWTNAELEQTKLFAIQKIQRARNMLNTNLSSM